MMEQQQNKSIYTNAESTVENDNGKERWNSRTSFILAAVGSAIGLGNFWRFPYLSFKWGGGAFFVPYLIALVFVGIPMMQLELGIGQVFQKSATQAFGELNPRLRGLGLTSGAMSFLLLSYYTMLIAWGIVYLIQSFFSDIPFSINGLTGNAVLEKPANHFYSVVKPASDPAVTQIISSGVFAAFLGLWVSIIGFMWKGQKVISKALYFTVLMPVVMLMILMIIGLTLEGSGEGIKQYIGQWDMSLLSEGDMWSDAFGQIFFSLSICLGVMPAFASMNPRDQNVFQDGVIVPILNCSFSFMAGFAVFSIVGYYAVATELGWGDTLSGYLAGVNLAFIAYPSALTLVSDGAGANVLCIMFFLTFYLLGIDSAFSLVESIIMNFHEIRWFQEYSKTDMLKYVCFLSFLSGMIYTSDIGIYCLDTIDSYVTKGLLLIGFMESVAAGWVFSREELTQRIGCKAVLFWEIGIPGGFFLFTLLSVIFGYYESIGKTETYAISFGVGLSVMALGACLAVMSSNLDALATLSDLLFFQTDALREILNKDISKKKGNWQYNRFWALLIRFVIPPILIYLLTMNFASTIDSSGILNGSVPLPWVYQMAGALSFVISIAFFILGYMRPNLFRLPSRIDNMSSLHV